MIDSLGPYMPRTVVVASATATTVVSADLMVMPSDSTLLVGGFFRKSDGTITYVSGFDQATGTATVQSWTAPSPGAVLEYWKAWRPTVVDTLIKSGWNEMRRRLWVPDVQVWTVRDQFRRQYAMPTGWTHIYGVSWGQALSAGGVGSQPMQTIPSGVSGPALYDFTNVHDVSARTDVAQGVKFTGDTWVKYIAVYVKRGGSAEPSGTATLSVQTDTAGSPSGTSVASATRNLADIPYMPQWVVFDLGTPVRLVANTQYHMRLSLSTAVDGVVYIAWARTQDTSSYTNGQLKNWDGATWTAPGYVGLFLTFREQGGWYPLQPDEWMVAGDRQLDFLDYQAIKSYRARGVIVPDATLIRIEGLRYPAQPSDTTQLEVPYDYLLNKAAYDLVKGRVRSAGWDPDDWADRLRDWKSSFELAQSVAVLRRPANSRRIMDTTP